MSAPESEDWMRLKRLGRYLVGEPRMRVWFEFQNMPDDLTIWTDSDHAGCTKTRKSTSGGLALLGSHLIKSWSSTQDIVALSSGEAEYYGIVKGAAQGFGIRSMLNDIGISVKVSLNTDASAAKGIAMRKGLGRVRHIEVNHLWVQYKVISGALVIHKVGTDENLADVLTKYVGKQLIDKHIAGMSLLRFDSRHELAPVISK